MAEIRGYLWWRLGIFEPHPHFSRYFCHPPQNAGEKSRKNRVHQVRKSPPTVKIS
ncbi:hypothetical protein HMPREF9278_1144 [Mobiluncus mulieris FB024-16]|nr:hypothetical protein HMPREF9278_1144 [Mobiluncus mulieris FB024-16]